MNESYTVAVVGATGVVGKEMIQILEERNFPIKELRPLASSRSAGTELSFHGKPVKVRKARPEEFEGCDIALFSAGSELSRQLAPEAWKRGCIVIDNSSAWRMDPDVPLVVPEINPTALDGYAKKGIIGNPNCSTIQMVMALKPLHDVATLKRVIVSTYQSAAGAGQKAIQELQQQTVAALNMQELTVDVYPHQLAFNVIPHIDRFLDNGYTKEEQKMVEETRKIMELAELRVSATCVRVPVFCSHSEAVTAEFEKPLTPDEAKALLLAFPGIEIIDDPANNRYPMPLTSTTRDEVFVGRLRQDPDDPHTLHFWVVSDNLRKGAALNAVQIAELMISDYLD